MVPTRFDCKSLLALLLLGLAGCAATPSRTDVAATLILPTSAERYVMAQNEQFLVPVAIESRLPDYPTNVGATPDLTVCVEVVISEEGDVQSVMPIASNADCSAVADPLVKPFLSATIAAVRTWKYLAAGICRYQQDANECAFETATIQAVPVSLAYRFAFSVRDGKPTVQSVPSNRKRR